MKPFTGTGYTQNSLVLTPPSPSGVSAPILINALRQRLNYGTAGNHIKLVVIRGGR